MSAQPLLPLEDALNALQQQVQTSCTSHTVLLEDALDCILAEDIHAPINVPGYDNSAMDGYAIHSSSLQNTDAYTQVGKSFAGGPYNGTVKVGETVRIMTGAPMPAGTDTVIMQENAIVDSNGDNDTVRFEPAPKAGSNVRLAGNDIHTGDNMLQQGKRLSPINIAIIASLGIKEVSVYKPLKVGIFSTGDELTLPGTALNEGCIYDSNRFMIAAVLKRLGYEVLNLGIIEDDPQKIEAAFTHCAEQCDAVISSGGVSVGEADYTRDILQKIGDIHFWKLALKPGKPFAFGKIKIASGKTATFFGLPGNPVSAVITLHQLALPAMQKMSGEKNISGFANNPVRIRATLDQDIRKKPGRSEFQRGILHSDENAQLHVTNSGSQSSGMLSSMNISNCYIKLEQDQGNVTIGDSVEVIPLDRWFS